MKYIIALVLSIILLLGSTGNNITAQTEFDEHGHSAKIGIARWVESSDFDENIQGFKESLEDYGFIEGENIEYFEKNPNGDKLKQREIIQEFIEKDVDVIFSLTTPGTLIAKEMTQDIPIVFSIVTFPVGANIIESYESSGNNLVGTSNFIPVEKQLDLIFDITEAKSVGFLHRYGEPNSEIQFSQMRDYGQTKGIDVIKIDPSSLEEVEQIINQKISGVDVLYNACDTLVQSGAEEISIRIGLENNKPAFSCLKGGIKSGGLAGNVADPYTLGKLAGNKAVMILHGGDPSDIMSEKQKGDHIFVNSQTAKQLGIDFPRHLENIILERFD